MQFFKTRIIWKILPDTGKPWGESKKHRHVRTSNLEGPMTYSVVAFSIIWHIGLWLQPLHKQY